MIRSSYDIVTACLVWGIVICVSFVIYERFVRPHIVSASHDCTVCGWIRQRWDVFAAAVIAGFAAAWNSFLDIVIIIIQAFPDALQSLASLDLTPYELPSWLRLLIQIGAAVVPAFRAARAKP